MKVNAPGLAVICVLLVCVVAISILSIEPTEEVLSEAIKVAEENFDNTTVEPNEETDRFSFYLPEEYDIEKQTKNNLILIRDDQTYILFYNAFEDRMSRLNYEAAKESDYTVLESFEKKDRFGYIHILEDEEEMLQLQIGVGGVKITTISEKGRLAEDAKQMMLIANSIAYENHQ